MGTLLPPSNDGNDNQTGNRTVRRVKGIRADGQIIADYRHCFGNDQAAGWRRMLHVRRVA